jgi:acetyl-CoA C-acetyltransferase
MPELPPCLPAAAFADANSIKPLVRIVAGAVTAVNSAYFGIAPVSAIQLATKRASWIIPNVEYFEINGASAAVPLAVAKELGFDLEKVNVDSDAVAHGHPIGATDAILLTRLIHSMRRDGLRKRIVFLCIDGGQDMSLVLKSIN